MQWNIFTSVFDAYSLNTKEIQQQYQDVIVDFSYFKISEVQDKKINSSNVSDTIQLLWNT